MDSASLVSHLDQLLDAYQKMATRSGNSDLSDIDGGERQSLVTRSVAAIKRIAGERSSYSIEAERVIASNRGLHKHLTPLVGVVRALREDLVAGALKTYAEMVHAQVFSNFLDMASHLQALGYKDAAAVIAGSTLESHLRELASKNAVPIDDASGRPLKAEKLNADLARSAVYNLLDQKLITAHLDLRNKAAHGKYSDYTAEQVSSMIGGITELIRRLPA